MPLSLEQLNGATQSEFALLLDGTYEHSPWIAEQAWAKRPFASLAQLTRSPAMDRALPSAAPPRAAPSRTHVPPNRTMKRPFLITLSVVTLALPAGQALAQGHPITRRAGARRHPPATPRLIVVTING